MLIIDQIGHKFKLDSIPKRIISLVPSQTELLFDLELDEEVVGITKFCIHPKEWFDTKSRVGGTKNLNLAKISDLQPDLIFLSSEPYPFKEKQLKELQILSPNSKIVLVDGEYFSWYGSRLQQAVSYFIALMEKMA